MINIKKNICTLGLKKIFYTQMELLTFHLLTFNPLRLLTPLLVVFCLPVECRLHIIKRISF